MNTEGEPNIELIEAEVASYIDAEIEKIPEGEIDAARETSGNIQDYLQERANELFAPDNQGRDV